MNIGSDTIDYAIERNKVLTVTSYSYLGIERDYIDRVLRRYLAQIGMHALMNNISYCIHEVAGNAHKANLKRLYFELKGLDINDPRDYRCGMEQFKQEALQHPKRYSVLHKERGYYIKFHFQIDGDSFKIVIRNNVPLTLQEKERIARKIEIARDASDLADVYAVSEDYTEGAGLGIVMLHIMLKNLGFNADSFRIYTRDQETIAFLSLDVRNTELLIRKYTDLLMVS